MLPPVAPSGLAQPITTSSTSPGSMPARLTAWLTTCPPMSAPWVRLKTPRTALPIGVRAVDTMTASTMALVPSLMFYRNSGSRMSLSAVMPAKAGTHASRGGRCRCLELLAWIPACAGMTLTLLRDQLLLRQLADCSLRQGIAKLQVRRHLVPAELVGQERPQLIERKAIGARLQLHERLGRLAAISIRHADHDHLGDGRV